MPRRPARASTDQVAPPPAAASRLRWLGLWGALAAGVVVLLMYQPWSTAESGKAGRDEFASERGSAAPGEKPAPFDGKRAMGHLEALCKIGPRISGTEGMTRQQELIEKHFKDL